MAETPEERLARLRREVEATWVPPNAPTEPTSSPPVTAAPTASLAGEPPSTPAPAHTAQAAPAPAPAPAPFPPALQRSADEPPSSPASLSPVQAAPRGSASTPAAPSAPAATLLPSAGPTRPTPTALATDDDGWSLADALGGAGLGQWVAIGLVAVGGYLLLTQLVSGLAFPGSILLAVAGVVLLWLHFNHRAGAWALYGGAILAAAGTLRAVSDSGILPFVVNGATSLGLGLALMAIGHLRHSQAGGYGWQGAVGLVALAWGGLQFALGLLPGSPDLLDLVVPALILGAGVVLLARTMGKK